MSPTAACGQRREAEGRWGQRWPGPGPRRHCPLAPRSAVSRWPPACSRDVAPGAGEGGGEGSQEWPLTMQGHRPSPRLPCWPTPPAFFQGPLASPSLPTQWSRAHPISHGRADCDPGLPTVGKPQPVVILFCFRVLLHRRGWRGQAGPPPYFSSHIFPAIGRIPRAPTVTSRHGPHAPVASLPDQLAVSVVPASEGPRGQSQMFSDVLRLTPRVPAP